MLAQTLTVAAVTGAVGALVVCELQASRAGAALAKTVASAGFLVLALLRADVSNGYDRWVVIALVLCLLGDVLLLVPRAFPVGLASFLVAHLAYIGAFSVIRAPRGWPWPVAVPLVVAGVAAASWLWPHLGRMRAPVLAYVAAITGMAWGSIAAAAVAAWPIAAGGVLFYLSDLAVARDRFVVRRFASRAWGLPAYYLAQVLFALTLGRTGLGRS